ncbi:hypothetical protein CYMTET_17815, partial [Cymbomonas tetramitiformis]
MVALKWVTRQNRACVALTCQDETAGAPGDESGEEDDDVDAIRIEQSVGTEKGDSVQDMHTQASGQREGNRAEKKEKVKKRETKSGGKKKRKRDQAVATTFSDEKLRDKTRAHLGDDAEAEVDAEPAPVDLSPEAAVPIEHCAAVPKRPKTSEEKKEKAKKRETKKKRKRDQAVATTVSDEKPRDETRAQLGDDAEAEVDAEPAPVDLSPEAAVTIEHCAAVPKTPEEKDKKRTKKDKRKLKEEKERIKEEKRQQKRKKEQCRREAAAEEEAEHAEAFDGEATRGEVRPLLLAVRWGESSPPGAMSELQCGGCGAMSELQCGGC